MHPVESIVRQSLTEEMSHLEGLKKGEGFPPSMMITAEQVSAIIAESEERIRSMQAKLDDPTKLQEWWDGIDESDRIRMLNT